MIQEREVFLNSIQVDLIYDALKLYQRDCADKCNHELYQKIEMLVLKFGIEKQKHYVDFKREYGPKLEGFFG